MLDDSILKQKLDKFIINHHASVRNACKHHQIWWEQETSRDRCRKCWLRKFNCFCDKLNSKRVAYQDLNKLFMNNFQLIIYYHYLEVGRSANTAHILEALLPSNNCANIFFGDDQREIQLMEQLRKEYDDGVQSTCILYPTSSAVTVREWKERILTPEYKTIRLISLDGTYSQAARQFKHLQKAAAFYNIPLPVVKLDLPEQGCQSAYAGLMNQPSKDKICTYQASIMALKELGLDNSTFNCLKDDLDDWISHILDMNIKLGKTKIKVPLGLEDKNMKAIERHENLKNKDKGGCVYLNEWRIHQDPIYYRSIAYYIVITKTNKFSTFDIRYRRRSYFANENDQKKIK